MLYALILVLALQPAPTPQVVIPLHIGPFHQQPSPRDVLTSVTVSVPSIPAIHADTVKIYNYNATVSARPGKWDSSLRNAVSGRRRFASATVASHTARYTLHNVTISSYQGTRSDQAVPTISFTLLFTSADRHRL